MPFTPKSLNTPQIVGVIAGEADLCMAARASSSVDMLEWRVDAFPDGLVAVGKNILQLQKPLIVTVRDPREKGGQPDWDVTRRIELFMATMQIADLVDIEIANLESMGDVIEVARAEKKGLILSHHNFQDATPFEELERLANQALQAKADVFKVAIKAHNFDDLVPLVRIATEVNLGKMKLALMAMGPKYGKVSRLLLGIEKSVFIYVYLTKPPTGVTGQWQAAKIRGILAELHT